MTFFDARRAFGNFFQQAICISLLAGFTSTAAIADVAPPLPPNLQLDSGQSFVNDSSGSGSDSGSGSSSSGGNLPGQIVLSENFESNRLGALKTQSYFNHALNIVDYKYKDAPTSSPYGGNRFVRFELRPEDLNEVNRFRTEVLSNFSGVMKANKTNWGEWYLYFPKNFNPGKLQGHLIIGQIHGNGSPDKAPVMTITLQYESKTGDYYWNVMGKTLKSGKPVGSNITVNGIRGNEFKEHGKWVKLKFQFKASLSNNGILKVWKDDQLLGEMSGNVGTSVTKDPYFKTGLYHRGTNDMVMYADDIKLSIQ